MTAPSSSQQHIFDVAKTLFTQRGFSNVSMRDICNEARVTAPTVYYYFKSKEVLFEAVVRETITMEEFTDLLSIECKKAKDADSQIRAAQISEASSGINVSFLIFAEVFAHR